MDNNNHTEYCADCDADMPISANLQAGIITHTCTGCNRDLSEHDLDID